MNHDCVNPDCILSHNHNGRCRARVGNRYVVQVNVPIMVTVKAEDWPGAYRAAIAAVLDPSDVETWEDALALARATLRTDGGNYPEIFAEIVEELP